jgi:hypothetical protein
MSTDRVKVGAGWSGRVVGLVARVTVAMAWVAAVPCPAPMALAAVPGGA